MPSFQISVIIPTFNRARTLIRAIESVLTQTLLPAEIIVIDDGSTDDTKDLISNLSFPIVYHYQENRGVSAARNTGLKIAKHPWIALLDSDDAWHPSKLEQQVNSLIQHPEFQFCHTNEIWYKNQKFINQHKKHQKKGGFIYEHCLPLCAISPF